MFFTHPIPKASRFLLKYFRSDLERQFLRYAFWSGDMSRFTAHTGYYCQPRWLDILTARLDKLKAIHAGARSGLSEEGMALLARIERGELTFREIDSLAPTKKENA